MLELFRRLGLEIASQPPPPQDHKFQLAPRVVIFPEAICPWCEKTLRCRRIWQFGDGVLKAWWDVVRGPSRGRGRKRGWLLVFKKPHRTGSCPEFPTGYDLSGHPHSLLTSGSICMGNAETEEQALFLGMSPTNSYWVWYEWIPWLKEVWNHRCKPPEDD